MNLLCDRCKKKFIASEEQEKFISDSRNKGMKFMMIKCPHCSMSYPFNPMLSNTSSPTERPVGDGLRCPKETCSGIVSYIDDVPSFWGCGECGNVWFKKDDLYSDIKSITNKYPYRGCAYKIIDNEYFPAADEDIPASYDEQIKSEWNN
ncbi:hypothetical protein ODD08_004050 [Salmonella enterica]|nr:hypothetical protein [Salmonella enterica]